MKNEIDCFVLDVDQKSCVLKNHSYCSFYSYYCITTVFKILTTRIKEIIITYAIWTIFMYIKQNTKCI